MQFTLWGDMNCMSHSTHHCTAIEIDHWKEYFCSVFCLGFWQIWVIFTCTPVAEFLTHSKFKNSFRNVKVFFIHSYCNNNLCGQFHQIIFIAVTMVTHECKCPYFKKYITKIGKKLQFAAGNVIFLFLQAISTLNFTFKNDKL